MRASPADAAVMETGMLKILGGLWTSALGGGCTLRARRTAA